MNHFTGNSASVIDFLFAANTESLLILDVGEPYFNLNMRYHCQVHGVSNFIKQNTNVSIELSGNMTRYMIGIL